MQKKDKLNKLKNVILVIIGTILIGIATGLFIIPFNLITGGMSGIAILLNKVLPLSLSTEFYITILTWIFFFLGWIFLGKNFALKTLISTILYPVALSVSVYLLEKTTFGKFFDITNSKYQDISVLLAATFGGALIGAGCSLTFLGGGSSGGTDILALLICKLNKKIKSGAAVFLIDAGIILLGIFVLNDFVLSLLGILSAFICAIAIDKIFIGESTSFSASIITDAVDDINKEILEQLDRSSTTFEGIGAYTKEKKKMILVSFKYNQYRDLINIIEKHDKDAFVMIERVHEINGEGWD